MYEVALLSGRFRSQGQRVFPGKISLYADRIVFCGLLWKGKAGRTLPLSDVASVVWHDGLRPPESNITLCLQDGSVVDFWVKSAGLWKFKIEELAPNLKPMENPLPEAIQPAA